jgi:hypothetical protein
MSGASLATVESTRLAELESVVKRCFVEAGRALAEIRDSRLYRPSYPTFEDYCTSRWNYTARRARQLIVAAEVAGQMGTRVAIPGERHVRELLPLVRSKGSEAAARVYDALSEDGAPTVAEVRAAVANETTPIEQLVEVDDKALCTLCHRYPGNKVAAGVTYTECIRCGAATPLNLPPTVRAPVETIAIPVEQWIELQKQIGRLQKACAEAAMARAQLRAGIGDRSDKNFARRIASRVPTPVLDAVERVVHAATIIRWRGPGSGVR